MKITRCLLNIICVSIFIGLSSFFSEINTGLANDVFNQTNQFRKSQGLPALTMQEDLNAIAQQHSANMASGKTGFGHNGFAKRNAMAGQNIKGLHGFAENVAFGASSGLQVVTMWKNSSGHRRNMLGPYKYIGIGIAKDKHGQIFYTEIFAG